MMGANGLLALLRHEIVERRLLLLGSGLLGLLPLAAPLFPGPRAGAAPELRDTTALFLAFVLSGLVALLLGATAIGSDLAERRLSFFFSRPLSGWTIWAGKLGGATLCAWIAGLLALLPALVVSVASGGGPLHNPVMPDIYLALWTVALPLPVLAAHVAGVSLRTRSVWLLVDLLAAAAVTGILWASLRRLVYWGVIQESSAALPVLALAAGVALLAATAVQVLGGRTDPMRGHRLQSLTLGTLGLVAALAFAGGAERLIAIGPLDLDQWSAMAAVPGQNWVAVVGSASGPPKQLASYLLQPATGRSIRTRLATLRNAYVRKALSGDGRRVVWAEPLDSPLSSPAVLVRLDLDRPGARPVRTPIALAAPPYGLALSPSGRSVAAYRDRLSVFDVDSGRLLAAPTLEGDSDVTASFLGEDRLRILATRNGVSANGTITAYELDLVSRRLVELATIPSLSYLRVPSPDGTRLVFNQLGRRSAAVFDLTSGRQLTELRQPGQNVRAMFLADGRLVEAIHGSAGTEIRILDPDSHEAPGSPRFHLPQGGPFELLQPTPDRLLAAPIQGASGGANRTWEVLDLQRGLVHTLGSGIVPVPTLGKPGAGGASPLFWEGGHFVRIDLDSGHREILGPARPYHPDPWEPY